MNKGLRKYLSNTKNLPGTTINISGVVHRYIYIYVDILYIVQHNTYIYLYIANIPKINKNILCFHSLCRYRIRNLP